MYPWYKGYFPNIELTYDDIQGIQALYGEYDLHEGTLLNDKLKENVLTSFFTEPKLAMRSRF